MSLINEALKKAQRSRHDEPATSPAPGGTAPATKRAPARGANTMVLLGSGAVVLVVLSVVATVYLVNRPTAPSAPAAPTAALTTSPSSTSASASESATTLIVPALPAISGPTPGVTPTPSAPPRAATPSDPTPVSASPEAVAVAPQPSPAPAPSAPASSVPAAPAKPDERVAAFVDTIKVAGIRSSGTDSRVLMNDRVVRVNDIVERTLGVKLVEVSTESLTFSDPAGATYVKNF